MTSALDEVHRLAAERPLTIDLEHTLRRQLEIHALAQTVVIWVVFR